MLPFTIVAVVGGKPVVTHMRAMGSDVARDKVQSRFKDCTVLAVFNGFHHHVSGCAGSLHLDRLGRL